VPSSRYQDGAYRNPDRLRKQEAERLVELFPEEVVLRTARTYRSNWFSGILALPIGAAQIYFQRCDRISTAALEPVVRVARMLRQHGEGLLDWFCSRTSNGLLEGINSLVQAAKAKTRGYGLSVTCSP
jgi:transposase